MKCQWDHTVHYVSHGSDPKDRAIATCAQQKKLENVSWKPKWREEDEKIVCNKFNQVKFNLLLELLVGYINWFNGLLYLSWLCR